MGERVLRHPADAWAPQTGPQTTFASTSADIAIIGGSPGGGKSVADLYEFKKLTLMRRTRRLRGVALRRTEVALLKPGSLWDRAKEMAPAFGGRVLEETRRIVFEAATGQIEDQHWLDFGHLHAVGSERLFDGAELDVVILEELQDFDETQFWYLCSRLRTTRALRPRIRASCNAEPDIWLAALLFAGGYIGDDGYARPEMSGVVQWIVRDEDTDELRWYRSEAAALAAHPELEAADLMSFTFVLARTSDNAKLRERDPGYRGRMRNLLRRDRLRLYGEGDEDRGGNWLASSGAGEWFARDAIKFVDSPPSKIVRTARGWDFGSIASDEPDWRKGPDWTEGARVSWCEGGELWIDDVVGERRGPLETTELVLATAALDGPLVVQGVFQDAGAAGKRDAETTAAAITKERLTARVVRSERRQDETDGAAPKTTRAKKERSSKAKQAFARPWALLAKQGRVYASSRLAPAAKERLRVQTHRFPNAPKDDLVDAVSCAVEVLEVGAMTMIDAIAIRARAEAEAEAQREKSRRTIEERELARAVVPELDVDAWLGGRRT